MCVPLNRLLRGAVGSFDSTLGYLVAFGFCNSDVVLALKGKCWFCLLRLVIAPFSFVLPGLHDFSLGWAQLHKSSLFIKIKPVSRHHDIDRAKEIWAPNAGCCPFALYWPPHSDFLKEAFSCKTTSLGSVGTETGGSLHRSLVKHSTSASDRGLNM